jgi:hypothetical protein
MSSRHWLTLVIAVCGALAVTGAEAAAKKKAKVAKGPAPIASGCTYVQGMCLGLATSNKATYSLWDGKPWIPPRSGVDVWGKATGPGLCGGTAIQVSSWKPNKNLKCKA